MPGGHKPIRLPPLQTLRVKDPKRAPENPCVAIMSSVLGTFRNATQRVALSPSLHRNNTNLLQPAGLLQDTTHPAAPPSRTSFESVWTDLLCQRRLRTQSTTTWDVCKSTLFTRENTDKSLGYATKRIEKEIDENKSRKGDTKCDEDQDRRVHLRRWDFHHVIPLVQILYKHSIRTGYKYNQNWLQIQSLYTFYFVIFC